MSFEHRKISEILVEMGVLAPAEARLVLEQQDQLGQRFGEIAIDKGLIKDDDLAQALAQQFGLEYVDLDTFVADPELDEEYTAELSVRYNFIPLQKIEDGLVVAIADPTNVANLDELEMQLDHQLTYKVAAKSKINALLERLQSSKQVLQEVSEDFKLLLVKELSLIHI